ncbi:MAG: glycosyltransferase [Coriobacteriia bacterium]
MTETGARTFAQPTEGVSPTGSESSVSVVICAYTPDRWHQLMAAVRSVHAQTCRPEQIIVVIDHHPWLFEMARTRLAREDRVHSTVIESTGPHGLSGARNTGLEAARGDVIAFLDDDAVADPTWLEHLLAAYEDADVVAVGGRIVPAWESRRPDWFPAEFYWVIGCTYRGMPEQRSPVRNVIGANMSFRTAALRAAGGFCSELGRTASRPLGDEETEACIAVSLRSPGSVVLYEPAAMVVHAVPDSRLTFEYFVKRCHGEGLSKARLASRVGTRHGLSAERRHMLRTLPAGVARSLGTVLRGDISGLLQAGAIVGGLGATVGGYVQGRLMRPPTAPRTAPQPDSSDATGVRRRPRVAMVTPRFLPFAGGVENHVLQVARRLGETADVTVITTDPGGDLPQDEVVDGVRVRRVRAWPKRSDFHIAPGIWPAITHGSWDLVHVQSYHTAVAPIAMLAALDAEIPYVLTLHGGGHSSRLRSRLRSLQWSMLRPLLARARTLIAVARFEAEFFSRRLKISPARFVVIPNGSDLPQPDPLLAADLPHPLIVSIGRLERYKGHHRVVAALPRVLDSLPDAHLLILGSGPYQRAIERLAKRLGVSGRVEVRSIPAADRARMAGTLASADLVVLMSSFETHPLAVVEAAALGRPALVADTSGLRELAEDGFAHPVPLESDARELAEAIAAELKHPQPVRPVTLPKWEQCADAVGDVYARVLGTVAGGRRAAPEGAESDMRRLPVVSALAGCGMLAVALANNAGRLGSDWAAPLFWIGLGLVYLPAVLSLSVGGIDRKEILGIVAVVGVVLYIVSILDNPTLFTGYDELLHYRTLDDIARTGRLFSENPLLPISPYFPGLEVVTHALMSLTGMPGFAAGVTVVAAARLLGVLALHLLLERTGLEPRVAGLGVLMYMTGASFLFFSAQYAYESLALPLAVLTLFALREAQLEGGALETRLVALAAALTGVVVVTHHVTSYILAGVLVAWLLVVAVVRRNRFPEALPGQGWMPLFALGATFTWFAVMARATTAYLMPHMGAAMAELAGVIAGDTGGRRLFQSAGGQSAPLPERLVAVAAIALVLCLIVIGIRRLREHGRDNSLAYLLGFAILLYPASLALRFTQSGWQVGSRATAFIYVGIAFALVVGIESARASRRVRLGPITLTLLAAVLFAGGVIAGSTPHSRVSSPYTVGAGKTSIEAEGVGAATWARRVLGPGNRMVADSTISSLMGSYGQQRTLSSADGVSVSGFFLPPDFGEYQRSMIRGAGIEFVVVDRRIADVVPHQGYFFEKWERQVVDYGPTVGEETVGRFDTLPGVSRIYDSGHIQVYDVRGLGR